MSDFVLVKECENRLQADILKGYLEGEEIEVIVTSDDAGGMLPTLSPLSGVKIYVPKKDEAKAKEILENFL